MEPTPSSSKPSAATTSPARRPRRGPRLSPGKILALAVVSNLLIAGSVSATVAPVETSGTALGWYDALPSWLRQVLGDQEDGDETARGWLGDWLASFHANALRGDPKAQLKMSMSLTSEQGLEEWTHQDHVNLTWVNHGAALTYRIAVTQTPDPGDVQEAFLVETSATNASVPLAPGENWVHLQATHEGRHGIVETVGPFLSDPDPPNPPHWLRVNGQSLTGGHVEVTSYHFTLEWSEAQARSGITAYHLQREEPTGWATIAELDAHNRTHDQRNRPSGVHSYRVLAESQAGLLSAPGEEVRVQVDARGGLTPPGPGSWHFGINTVYDSVIHVWDISDPSIYSDRDAIHAGEAGLTAQEVGHYTDAGWGINTENTTLQDIVDDVVGDEQNALTIGLELFEWMFNTVDYDFEKLESGDSDAQRLLQAQEVLDAGRGICGDLTALFVTLMRIAGVPARPVHGYLINDGSATGQDDDFQGTIGGFHMWPEIYVGGAARDGPGGGWIPVDVSGVTGEFSQDKLHFYFGVANPNYLQLGVQEDLSEQGWNVWANLGYSYRGSQPTVTFDADAKVQEPQTEQGTIWFTPGSLDRKFCEDDETEDDCRAGRTNGFKVRGRSVRTMDYGADLSWSGEVHEVTLSLLYPGQVGPTQVVMWTAYERDPQCRVGESDPVQDDGFARWTIPDSQQPCQ